MSEKYNLNGGISEQWLAEKITKIEGGKETNIAQIKEILKITLDILAQLRDTDTDGFNDLLTKHL